MKFGDDRFSDGLDASRQHFAGDVFPAILAQKLIDMGKKFLDPEAIEKEQVIKFFEAISFAIESDNPEATSNAIHDCFEADFEDAYYDDCPDF